MYAPAILPRTVESSRAVKLEAELAEKAAAQEELEKQLAAAKHAAQEAGAEAASALNLQAQVKSLESQIAEVSQKKDAATKELATWRTGMRWTC